MTTSDPDSADKPIEDPDWLKGLVAKALLQAAEDEPEPLGPDSEPSPTPEPSSVTEPASAPESESAPPTPTIAPTSASIEHSLPAEPPTSPGAPLLIGRGLDDTRLLGGAGRITAASGSASTEAPRTPDPAPASASATASAGATAVVETAAPEATPLHAEPVLPADDSNEATGGDPRDQVMVEEDATVEGFRSSDIRTVLEWLAVIVSALVVALIIKAFVLQAFWIPSESMESTVNKGDRILVNKLSYRLHDIRRGDLVVFKKLPGTPGDTEDLIKRAIALPGETIEVRDDGRIWIWGPGETPADALLLQEPYLDPRNERLAAPSSTDSLSTDVWDEACENQPRTPGRCTLGPDRYFMMGDNRTSSSDSRFFGPVPEDLVVGRAFLRIWPLGELSSL